MALSLHIVLVCSTFTADLTFYRNIAQLGPFCLLQYFYFLTLCFRYQLLKLFGELFNILVIIFCFKYG